MSVVLVHKKYNITTQAIIHQTFVVEATDKKEARKILYSGEAEVVEMDSEETLSLKVISIEEAEEDEQEG